MSSSLPYDLLKPGALRFVPLDRAKYLHDDENAGGIVATVKGHTIEVATVWGKVEAPDDSAPIVVPGAHALGQLLASAPELLAAIRELGRWAVSVRADGNTPEFMAGFAGVIERADVAISAASPAGAR